MKNFSNQQLPNQETFSPAQPAPQTPLSLLSNTLPESAPILLASSSFGPISTLQSTPKESYQFPAAPLYALPPPSASLIHNAQESKTFELLSSSTSQGSIEKSQQPPQQPLSAPKQHPNFLPANQAPEEPQSTLAASSIKPNKYKGRKVILKKSKNVAFTSKTRSPAVNAASSSPTAPLVSANALLPLPNRQRTISEVTNEAQTVAASLAPQPKYSRLHSQPPTTHAESLTTGDNFGSRLPRAY